MDKKVKIVLMTVVALLCIILGVGIYKTLNPIDAGVKESAKSEKGKKEFNPRREKGKRAKVAIKNNKYYFPDRDKPRRKVNPDARDKAKLAKEQEQFQEQMALQKKEDGEPVDFDTYARRRRAMNEEFRLRQAAAEPHSGDAVPHSGDAVPHLGDAEDHGDEAGRN